jgi:hypothetical protein
MSKKKTYRDRCRYSGARSVAFWERVNTLKDRRMREFVYWQGVCLQDFESRVLQSLEMAEEEQG